MRKRHILLSLILACMVLVHPEAVVFADSNLAPCPQNFADSGEWSTKIWLSHDAALHSLRR